MLSVPGPAGGAGCPASRRRGVLSPRRAGASRSPSRGCDAGFSVRARAVFDPQCPRATSTNAGSPTEASPADYAAADAPRRSGPRTVARIRPSPACRSTRSSSAPPSTTGGPRRRVRAVHRRDPRDRGRRPVRPRLLPERVSYETSTHPVAKQGGNAADPFDPGEFRTLSGQTGIRQLLPTVPRPSGATGCSAFRAAASPNRRGALPAVLPERAAPSHHPAAAARLRHRREPRPHRPVAQQPPSQPARVPPHAGRATVQRRTNVLAARAGAA